MININGVTQTCPRCGSDNLSIINYDLHKRAFVVWCIYCSEQAMENVIMLDKINGINFWMDE